jgi:hypothetical protein
MKKYIKNILSVVIILSLWPIVALLIVCVWALLVNWSYSSVDLISMVTKQIILACGFLFVGLIVLLFSKLAQELFKFLRKLVVQKGIFYVMTWGFIVCLLIVLVFDFTIWGEPTCIEYDSFNEVCDEYVYITKQKVENFVFFITVLYIPVIICSLQAKFAIKNIS